MQRGILVTVIFLLACLLTYGQSGKKKKRNKGKNTTEAAGPTSVDPNYSIMDYAPKGDKSIKSKGITYDAERRFYERKEMIEKARRKAEKELMKPQYTDPMYFGHKRPPKKHKPGKMKFCKVCGIRH